MSLASPHPLGHCHLPPPAHVNKAPSLPWDLRDCPGSFRGRELLARLGCGLSVRPASSAQLSQLERLRVPHGQTRSRRLPSWLGCAPTGHGLGQRQSPSHTFPSPSNSGLIRRHLSGAPGKDTVPVRACPCVLVSCPRASLCPRRACLAMVWGQAPMPCQLMRTHTSRQPWLPQGKDCPDNHMDTEPGPTGPTHTAPAHTPAHWGLTRAPSRTQDQQVSPHQTLTRT